MFLGIVGNPTPHHYFNGHILLERISKEVEVTKLTSYSRFSDDFLVNSSIKSGEWRMAVADNIHLSTDKLTSMIVRNYCLDEIIADRMEVYTTTPSARTPPDTASPLIFFLLMQLSCWLDCSIALHRSGLSINNSTPLSQSPSSDVVLVGFDNGETLCDIVTSMKYNIV